MAICVEARRPPRPTDRQKLIEEKARDFFVMAGFGRRVYPDDVHDDVGGRVDSLTEDETLAALGSLESLGVITKETDENTGSEFYRLSPRQVLRRFTVPMPNNITEYFGSTKKEEVEALRRVYVLDTLLMWGLKINEKVYEEARAKPDAPRMRPDEAQAQVEAGKMTSEQLQQVVEEYNAWEEGVRSDVLKEWKKVFDNLANNPQAKALTGLRFDGAKTGWANTRHRKQANTLYWIDDHAQMLAHLADMMNKSTNVLRLGDYYTPPVNNRITELKLRFMRLHTYMEPTPENPEGIITRVVTEAKAKRARGSPNDDLKLVKLYEAVKPWDGWMNLADFIQLLANQTSDPRARIKLARLDEADGPEVKYRNREFDVWAGGTETMPVGGTVTSQTSVRTRMEQTLSPIYVPTGTDNYGIARHVAETMFKGFRNGLEVLVASVGTGVIRKTAVKDGIDRVLPAGLQRAMKQAAKRLGQDIAEGKTDISHMLNAKAPADKAGLDAAPPGNMAENRDPLTQSLVRWALAKSGDKKAGKTLLARSYLQNGLDYSKLTKAEKNEITASATDSRATFRAYLRRSDGTAARLQIRAGGKFEQLTKTGSGAKEKSVSELTKGGNKIEIWADPAANIVQEIAGGSKAFKDLYVPANMVISGLLAGLVEEDIQMFLNRHTHRDVSQHFAENGFIHGRGNRNPAFWIAASNEVAAWEAVWTAESIYGDPEAFFNDLIHKNDSDLVRKAFGLDNYEHFGREATLSDTLSEAMKSMDFTGIKHDVVGLKLNDSQSLDGYDTLIDYNALGEGNQTLGLFRLSGIEQAASRSPIDQRLSRLGKQVMFGTPKRWIDDATAKRIRRMTDAGMTEEERRLRMIQAAAMSAQTDIEAEAGEGEDSPGKPEEDINFRATVIHDMWVRFARLGKSFAVMSALARKVDYVRMRGQGARGSFIFSGGGVKTIKESPLHRKEGGSAAFHEVAHAVEHMLNSGRTTARAMREVQGESRGLQSLRAGGRTVGGARLAKADSDLVAASRTDSSDNFLVNMYEVILRKAYFRTWAPSDPANLLEEVGLTEQDVDEIVKEIVTTEDVTKPEVQEKMAALVMEEIGDRVAVLSLEHQLMHAKMTWDMQSGNLGRRSTSAKEDPLPPGFFDEMFWLHEQLGNIAGPADLEAIVKGDKDNYKRFTKAIDLYMTYMDRSMVPSAYWSTHSETFSQFFEEMAAVKIEQMQAAIPNFDPFLFKVAVGRSGLGFSDQTVESGLRFFDKLFGALKIEGGQVTGLTKTDFSADKFIQVAPEHVTKIVRDRSDAISGTNMRYGTLPHEEQRATPDPKPRGTDMLELVVHGNDGGLLRNGEMVAKVSVDMADALAMQQLSFADGLTPLNVIHAIEEGTLKLTPDGRELNAGELADLNATMRKFTNQGATLGKQLRAIGAIVPALLQKAGAVLNLGKGIASASVDSARAIGKRTVKFVPYLGDISIGGVTVPSPAIDMVSSELLGGKSRPDSFKVDPATGKVTGYPQALKPKKPPRTKKEKEAAAEMATRQFREYLGLTEEEFVEVFVGGSPDGKSPLNSLQFQTVIRLLIANTHDYSLTEVGLLPVLHREVAGLVQKLAERKYRAGFLAALGMGSGKTRIMAMTHRVRATLARKEAELHMQAAARNNEALRNLLGTANATRAPRKLATRNEARRERTEQAAEQENAREEAHILLWRSDPAYREIVSRGQTLVVTGGAAKEELMYGFYKAQYEVGNMQDDSIRSAEQIEEAFKDGKGIIDSGRGYRLIRFTSVREKLMRGFRDSGDPLSPNDGSVPDVLVPRVGDVVYVETYQQLVQGMADTREEDIVSEGRHPEDPLGPKMSDANSRDAMYRALALIPTNVRMILATLGLPTVALNAERDEAGNVTKVKDKINPLGRHKDELDPDKMAWWDGTIFYDESDQQQTLEEAEEQSGGQSEKTRADSESSSTAEISREIQRLLPKAHVGFFTGTPFRNSHSVIAMERVLMPAMTRTTPNTSLMKENLDRNPEARSDLMEWVSDQGYGDYWMMETPEDQISNRTLSASNDVKRIVTDVYNRFGQLLEGIKNTGPENVPITVVIDSANGLHVASDRLFEFKKIIPIKEGDPRKNLGDLTIKAKDATQEGQVWVSPKNNDDENKRISTWRRMNEDRTRLVERMGYHTDEMGRWAMGRSNDFTMPDDETSTIVVMNRFEDAPFTRYISHLLFNHPDKARIVQVDGEKYIQIDAAHYPTQNKILNFEMSWSQRTSVVNRVKMKYASKQKGGKFDPARVKVTIDRMAFNDYMWARKKGARIFEQTGEDGTGSDGGLRDKIRLENSNIVITMQDDGRLFASVLPQDDDGYMVGSKARKAQAGRTGRGGELRESVEVSRAEIAEMMGVREDGLVFIGKEEGSGMTAEVFAKPEALLTAPGHAQAAAGHSPDFIEGTSAMGTPYPDDAELAVDELIDRADQEGIWVGEVSGRNKMMVPKSQSPTVRGRQMRRVRVIQEPEVRREHDLTYFQTPENGEKRMLLMQFDSGARGIEVDAWLAEMKSRLLMIMEPSAEPAKNAQMSGRVIRSRSLPGKNWVHYNQVDIPPSPMEYWKAGHKIGTMSKMSTGMENTMLSAMADFPILTLRVEDDPIFGESFRETMDEWSETPNRFGGTDLNDALNLIWNTEDMNYAEESDRNKAVGWLGAERMFTNYHLGKLPYEAAMGFLTTFEQKWKAKRQEYEDRGMTGVQKLPGKIALMGGTVSEGGDEGYKIIFAKHQEQRVHEDFDVVFAGPVKAEGESAADFKARQRSWLRNIDVQRVVGETPTGTKLVQHIYMDRNKRFLQRDHEGSEQYTVHPMHVLTFESDKNGNEGRLVDYHVRNEVEGRIDTVHLTQNATVQNIPFEEIRDMWNDVRTSKSAKLEASEFNSLLVMVSGSLISSEIFGMREAWGGSGETVSTGGMRKVAVEAEPDLAEQLGGVRDGSLTTAWVLVGPEAGTDGIGEEAKKEFYTNVAPILLKGLEENGVPDFDRKKVTAADVKSWFRDQILQHGEQQYILRRSRAGLAIEVDLDENKKDLVIRGKAFTRSGDDAAYWQISERDEVNWNTMMGQHQWEVDGVVGHAATMLQKNVEEKRYSDEQMLMILQTMLGLPEEIIASASKAKKK